MIIAIIILVAKEKNTKKYMNKKSTDISKFTIMVSNLP